MHSRYTQLLFRLIFSHRDLLIFFYDLIHSIWYHGIHFLCVTTIPSLSRLIPSDFLEQFFLTQRRPNQLKKKILLLLTIFLYDVGRMKKKSHQFKGEWAICASILLEYNFLFLSCPTENWGLRDEDRLSTIYAGKSVDCLCETWWISKISFSIWYEFHNFLHFSSLNSP